MRINPFRWFRELERDKQKVVGRLDSRFENYETDTAGERTDFDASEVSDESVYVATFHVQPWDQTGNTQVAEVLRAAMTQQGFLKVLVLCGYCGVAIPFNGIEHTVESHGAEPSVRKNISFAYYESGHMVYIDQKANDELHKDVDYFINSSYRH